MFICIFSKTLKAYLTIQPYINYIQSPVKEMKDHVACGVLPECEQERKGQHEK